jgi:hypothetical protein
VSVFDPDGIAKGWAATADAACRMLREVQREARGDGRVQMAPLADLLGVSRSAVYNWRKGRTVCQDARIRAKIQELAAQWRAIEAARDAARKIVAELEAA